jgi:hypothetical protein
MPVAQSLQNLLDNPLVATCLDRSQLIKPCLNSVLNMWRADLTNRRPAPAYIAGVNRESMYQGTDLDLLSVLMTLSQRRAVINIPSYENLRKSSLKSNQHVVTRENRHGKIIKPISNMDTHAFSIMMMDFNIAETRRGRERIGAPRNFALVDDSGNFYDGWQGLEWISSKEENQFIAENQLEVYPDSLEFTHFVHPSLAFSFYGSPYLITKTLASRIADQASHYRKLAQQLRKKGIKLRRPSGGRDEEVKSWTEGETRPQKVKNLEAKLILPEFIGSYPLMGVKEDGHTIQTYDKMPPSREAQRDILRYSKWISRKLSFRYGPMVCTPMRAVELAFFKYGFKGDQELKPGWAVPDWNRDFKEKPKSRNKWNILELNPHVQLLYRIAEKTARIATYK